MNMLDLDTADMTARFVTMASRAYGSNWQRRYAENTRDNPSVFISQSNLSKMINGRVRPSGEMRNRMAAAVLMLEQRIASLDTALGQALTEAVSSVQSTVQVNPLRAEINERFDIVQELVQGVIDGHLPSMILSGPPGLGKSFGVLRQLGNSNKQYDAITGGCTAPGLYQALYRKRDGGLVLIDDCDDVFASEDMLNLLKAVTNTDADNRVVSWRKQASWIYSGTDEERLAEIAKAQEEIKEENAKDNPNQKRIDKMVNWIETLERKYPETFEFHGQVIFITNKDLIGMVEAGGAVSMHIEALIDRSNHIDLEMNSVEKKVERIVQAIEEFGLMDKHGIDKKTQVEVIAFVRENGDRFKTLSFRSVEKISGLCKSGPNWRKVTAVTQFRRGS